MHNLQIQALFEQGMSPEDISSSLNIPLSVIKSHLYKDVSFTDDERIELKDLIFEIARGQAADSNVESRLHAAIYLHKSDRDDRRSTIHFQSNQEIIDLLKEKAASRMKRYAVPMIEVEEV